MNIIPIGPSIDPLSVIDKWDIAASTKKDYKCAIKQFISFIEGDSFDAEILIRYKQYLANDLSIKGTTKRQLLSSAKRFLNYCYKVGWLDKNIAESVKNFKSPDRHLRNGLNQSEVDSVFQKVKHDPMLSAMFKLMAYNGLRQFEVLNIEVEDINYKDNIIMSKRKKQDSKSPINIHPDVMKSIFKYLKSYDIKSGFIFPSPRCFEKPRTTRWMQKTWRKIFTNARLDDSKTLHGFRHFYITTILDITSGDISLVMRMAGLKSLETIQSYDDDRRMQDSLSAIHQKLNPSG